MSNLSLINVNAALQPLTQKNYLNRIVRDAIQPEYIWRNASSTDAENFPHRQGMPEIISVRGLLAPNLTPNNVSSFTDPLAGMTVSNAVQYEQYLGSFDRYDHLLSVDVHGEDYAIVSQYEENAESLAQYASSVADFLARNALYKTYTGGNTFLTANSASSNTTITVDNINGFVATTNVGDVTTPTVLVNGVSYGLTAVTPAGSNTSGLVFTDATGTFGASGTLTLATGLTGNVSTGMSVVATNAPQMVRPTGITNYNQIGSSNLLTGAMLRKGRAILSGNRVPKINGFYTLYADNHALQGLYQDTEFQNFFRGGYDSSVWEDGEITKMLGVRIVETTSNPLQYVGGQLVSRPMLVGKGALTEFQATDRMIKQPAGAGPVHTMIEDNVAFISRASIDPAAQFVTQSMLMFVGYASRTDRLLTSAVVPTASVANFKRAVAFEVAGV